MNRVDRERAMLQVIHTVLGDVLSAARAGTGSSTEAVLRDTIYEERKRLERESRKNPKRDSDRALIERIHRRSLHASPAEQQGLLRELTAYFVDEITGNFDERVYGIATRAVPRALALLLNALSPRKLFAKLPELPNLDTNVRIRGDVDTLRRLEELGTVILAPTHLSNLDSPIVGWALYALGLPPFLYGAGINLFQNPLLSFFMHNLGAYTVDRKKRARLYKRILKTYCTTTLEMGYNNLFFPGGTRSRSGAVEPRLKLGLLGCGLSTYVENLRKKKKKPNVYIVPCTLSYQLVLEAETLIEDYLKETGKARYVIEDDESSRLSAWLRFMSGLVSLDSRIFLTISSPLDLFGNRVEADGKSYDRRGRPIDTTAYVMRDGVPVHDSGRDGEYTKELGEAVLAAYKRDNVLQSTHIAAYVFFSLLRGRRPDTDLYRLLRIAPEEGAIPHTEVCAATQRVLDRIRELSEACEVRLDPKLVPFTGEEVVAQACRAFKSYHRNRAMLRRGDRVLPGDMKLLLYYHNRATGYGLCRYVDEKLEQAPIDFGKRPSGDPLLLSSREPKQGLTPPETLVGAGGGGAVATNAAALTESGAAAGAAS